MAEELPPDQERPVPDEGPEDVAQDQPAGSTTPPLPASTPDEEFVSADAAAAMAEALLAQVSAAVNDANDSTAPMPRPAPRAQTAQSEPPPAGSTPMSFPPFDAGRSPRAPAELDLLSDVNLQVKIELGRTRLLVEDVLKLNDGAVVELDKLAGDPVDIYVNERHVARGEVLVLNDNFCVRINEIVDPEERKVS
ncbi:MAG: flagellar motor switch protein FliN [Phycisphaerales bacterium]|nr:flagellar motor switch protein FliN [Phycisphaerales bacterium]